MTELEIMERAKMYIDKMANGINPLTGESIPEDELLNNVRISRCLFYVSDVLEKVIENGGNPKASRSKTKKVDFSLDSIDLNKVAISSTPIALSIIRDHINEQINTEVMKKITYASLSKMVISMGLLEEIITQDGKLKKVPTENGRNIGISTVQRISANGNEYETIVYNTDAQRFILDNLYGNV